MEEEAKKNSKLGAALKYCAVGGVAAGVFSFLFNGLQIEEHKRDFIYEHFSEIAGRLVEAGQLTQQDIVSAAPDELKHKVRDICFEGKFKDICLKGYQKGRNEF